MLDLTAVLIASVAGGFVNAIAGGGGLVSVPVLFGAFPHAPAAELLGTNKVAMVSGTLQAAVSYAGRVTLRLGTLLPAIVAALSGSVLGATAVTLVPNDFLRRLLPFMLAAVLVQTLLQPALGTVHAPRHAPRTESWLAGGIAFALGLYDGFFGPGTGSFLIFLCVRVLGFDFLHAAASAKILNAATNLGAIAVFAGTGNIRWSMVAPMIAANVAGSVLGTHLALRHGSRFIRPVFLTVVAVLILKTGFDAYAGDATTGGSAPGSRPASSPIGPPNPPDGSAPQATYERGPAGAVHCRWIAPAAARAAFHDPTEENATCLSTSIPARPVARRWSF